MAKTRHTLPLLTLAVILAAAGLLITVMPAPVASGASMPTQACQSPAPCASPAARLGLDPEKARRFAQVFRS